MAAKKEKEKPTPLSPSDIKSKIDEIVDNMFRIKDLQETNKTLIKEVVEGAEDEALTAGVVRKSATAIMNQKVEELDQVNKAMMSLIDIYNDN